MMHGFAMILNVIIVHDAKLFIDSTVSLRSLLVCMHGEQQYMFSFVENEKID